MTAVWLLPVVTLVVASSTGGLLAKALLPHSTTFALVTTTFSFVMVLIGLSLALMIIGIYLLRLITYGTPDATLILSAFIVVGEYRPSYSASLLSLMPLA
jgi:tellurite resistance protein TehA-like permease